MENNIKKITAVLGPTNTGKTHLAVETMLEHESGIIGFPLRLLAREIFDKCVNRVGRENVALITGEEKIIPKLPKYYICTVESMPQDKTVDFVAVDEIQMCTDHERGHIFTERLLNSRGEKLTMFIGYLSLVLILGLSIGLLITIAANMDEILALLVGLVGYLVFLLVMIGCSAYIYSELNKKIVN